jgi:hypothetical protein
MPITFLRFLLVSLTNVESLSLLQNCGAPNSEAHMRSASQVFSEFLSAYGIIKQNIEKESTMIITNIPSMGPVQSTINN